MLDINFNYKDFTIILHEVNDVDCCFLVKCFSSDLSFSITKNCISRPEAFRIIYKILAFIDNIV